MATEEAFREALNEAKGSANRQALTRQALIVAYSSQREFQDTRESVSQLLRLADAFVRPEDPETARWYRKTGDLRRLLGMGDEATALLAQAQRIESIPGLTTCIYRPPAGRAGRQLSAAARGKVIKAVEALGTFSEWANGPASKEKAEYARRLNELEVPVLEFLLSTESDEEPAAEAMSAALNCFREAGRLWPSVIEAWATGNRNVREAERNLGVKSPAAKREDERPRYAELQRPADVRVERQKQKQGMKATTEQPARDRGVGGDREKIVVCSAPTVPLRSRAEYVAGVPGKAPPTLDVIFNTRPTSEQAEAVLRACISVVAKTTQLDRELLASAWYNPSATGSADSEEGPLPLRDGSSHLSLDPKTRRIHTWNEREGLRRSTRDDQNGQYFSEYTERKVVVSPFGKFATLDVVFQKAPVESVIYATLVAEVKRIVQGQAPKLETLAYAKTGPRDDRVAQRVIRASNGKPIIVIFDPKSGEIRQYHGGGVLGSIR